VESIECGDSHTAILTTNGVLYTFGDNIDGQLGLGNGVFKSQTCVDKPTRVQEIYESIIQFSCGFKHTLALTRQG
jgi:X-linked retinitis pigmentosa GTPase regulator